MVQDWQWDGYVLVDTLPFIVVFGIELTIGPGYGLRSFVGFEAHIAELGVLWTSFGRETVVAEHKVVVRLQVLGSTASAWLQDFHGVGVLPLENRTRPRLFSATRSCGYCASTIWKCDAAWVVVSRGFHQRIRRRNRPRQCRVRASAFLENGAGARQVAFLQGGGVRCLTSRRDSADRPRDLFEGTLRAFRSPCSNRPMP